MRELIKECLRFGSDQSLVDELYNNERNFNNADTTSGQRCYSYSEIESMIQEAKNE